MRAGAEVDVAAGQAGQLGDAQPGLDGEQQQRVVAAAGPGAAVGAASSASISGSVRNVTSARSKRLGGIARTRWIVAACSGWRSAA